MKTPSLCAAVDRDLAAGHAAIVQIVSTGEALMERRLAEIPTEEWGDVPVDITPREYVLDYLAHSFPTQIFEPFTDEEGNLASRPVFRNGQPVQCRDAVERRDRMIERLAALPPVPGALDQIVQRCGTDQVAEITGRSRRIVRKGDRLAVENRAGSANLAEAQAFMDDEKRILVFSDAGGTGRSYHADLGAKNRRLRVHYLLEAGWKADTAIQGLVRSNRTNQVQPPLFRPVATNVKAEKRFLSTIAASDRCQRARHRPPGLARLDCPDSRHRSSVAVARRRLERSARRADDPGAGGRAGTPPRQGDGRASRRTRRLHRRHGRPLEGDGPGLGEHGVIAVRKQQGR
jgi:C-terminal domain on Strawberry notch homologue